MSLVPLKFHHVGIACENLESEKQYYQLLGYQEELAFIDPIQKVHGVFMILDSMRIEILEATDASSPILSYIKRGVKMYHQAFTSNDFTRHSQFLIDNGNVQLGAPQPAVAFAGAQICFFLNRNNSLIELIDQGTKVE